MRIVNCSPSPKSFVAPHALTTNTLSPYAVSEVMSLCDFMSHSALIDQLANGDLSVILDQHETMLVSALLASSRQTQDVLSKRGDATQTFNGVVSSFEPSKAKAAFSLKKLAGGRVTPQVKKVADEA